MRPAAAARQHSQIRTLPVATAVGAIKAHSETELIAANAAFEHVMSVMTLIRSFDQRVVGVLMHSVAGFRP